MFAYAVFATHMPQSVGIKAGATVALWGVLEWWEYQPHDRDGK